MQFVPLIPDSCDWKAIECLGGGEFLGEKEGVELWVMKNGKKVTGVTGRELKRGFAVCEIWVAPEWRGRWFSKAAWRAWCELMLRDVPCIVSDVDDERHKQRLERLGWKAYCQDGEVSYYLLTKEDAMRGKFI